MTNKIESFFGLEKANYTANIFQIITPGNEIVNFIERSTTMRYN